MLETKKDSRKTTLCLTREIIKISHPFTSPVSLMTSRRRSCGTISKNGGTLGKFSFQIEETTWGKGMDLSDLKGYEISHT